MKDVLGFLLMAAMVIGFIVFSVMTRPGNVASRRHARYQRRFETAKTPVDRLRHASAYLHEVAGASDAKTAQVAKELFALATRHNGAAAPAKTAAPQAQQAA